MKKNPIFGTDAEKEAITNAVSDRILFLGIMVSTHPEQDTKFLNKQLSELCCLYDYANRHNLPVMQ